MIIQCQGCAAKYYLAQDKVPQKPIKVRCPKCKAVFRLAPPVPREEENVIASVTQHVLQSETIESEAKQVPAYSSIAGTQGLPDEKPSKPGKGSKQDRALRLARVLVSDILFYNKEKRDQALIDGNLITVFGEDIKKSWELFKEKVGPDIAHSTNYFKDALNEILADGQKIF